MKTLVEKWLVYKEFNEGRSPKTIVKYRYYLELLIEYCDSNKIDGLNIEASSLESFVGMFLHKRKLVSQSRRTAVAAIKGFYDFLFTQGVTNANPASNLPYPASSKKMPVAMGISNFERLLNDCDLSTFLGLRDAAIIALLGGCGIRLGGLEGLNESSLTWYELEEKERLAIRVFEKRSKERMLPVPLEAHLFLRAYLGHPDLKQINRSLPDGDKVLFVSTRNYNIPEWEYYGEQRRLSSRSIQDMITARGNNAGIPANQCHPHALRHLTGTEYAEDDVDVITRQQLLGHADPKTTAIYTNMAMRRLTNTVDKANPLSKVSTAVTPLISRL